MGAWAATEAAAMGSGWVHPPCLVSQEQVQGAAATVAALAKPSHCAAQLEWAGTAPNIPMLPGKCGKQLWQVGQG